ncbi:3',5'-cyclic-nucleotide phosphodiesterase [Propionivibrio dicarboxylicus]|uniref:Ribonuclease BN, tRNA processing enzyme n=1 Tax=Propionivibrio dicarboxylicus TaxID=83767 RepID=A0A1G8FN53_9RHOO|nr:3',5'-cyclic-nucleotide phosphodiesterase [Propionivibrio dicarboxylicus]SDH83534.1 Ribonuclease BN, tRNA processing enzyme [Propionivibrio dicarboxylicus]
MKVRILGCNGGIGGKHLRTTSMLVDDDILIDAGTGVDDLTLAELAKIDHVFITHSHLDHIAALPLMIDSIADLRETPVTVYAIAPTLEILRNHVFNWAIWPDFSEISIRDKPVMQYQTIGVGETLHFGSRTITAMPALHTVPAVGYHLYSGAASLVFTGDTTVNDAFWPLLNQIENLRYLLIETAFSNRERNLAVVSMHLCPSMLAEELARMTVSPEVYVSHLKPGQIDLIMSEIADCAGCVCPQMLQNNHVFEF